MLTESHSVRLAVENGLETSEAYSTGLRYKVIDFSLSRRNGYQKRITSFFCLEATHACALTHNLVTRVVRPQNYTEDHIGKISIYHGKKIWYECHNSSAPIITPLMTSH